MDMNMMDNQTSPNNFHILEFSLNVKNRHLLLVAFFLMYVMGVLENLIMIILIYKDTHLHTPMYIFLSNLSFVDICLPTVIFPKLMDILLTGNNLISITHCLTQMSFSALFISTEIILLSSMAYDRYVAICKPLHYHFIMDKEKCVFLLGCTWISGIVISLCNTFVASRLPLCQSNEIHHFFCDSKALLQIFCIDIIFNIILLVETFAFAFFPFLFNLTSYIKIFSSILQIKSTEIRRKAFSTCTSHLTVLVILYGSLMGVYFSTPSENSSKQNQIISVLYTGVTPMLNPLIYCLRNNEVKSAVMRIMKLKIN